MSDDVRETNRAHWDALAAVHGQDAYYDAEALVGGADTLSRHENAAVGDVAGLDVLHLQCHIGFDSISLARRGARVTGVDFSPASLAGGATSPRARGVEVEFVEADATALPPALHGRFDLVYATIGVLCWIEDLEAWMRSVRDGAAAGRKARAGGDPPAVPWSGSGSRWCWTSRTPPTARARFDEPGSYADREAEVAVPTEIVYAHSLGEDVDGGDRRRAADRRAARAPRHRLRPARGRADPGGRREPRAARQRRAPARHLHPAGEPRSDG